MEQNDSFLLSPYFVFPFTDPVKTNKQRNNTVLSPYFYKNVYNSTENNQRLYQKPLGRGHDINQKPRTFLELFAFGFSCLKLNPLKNRSPISTEAIEFNRHLFSFFQAIKLVMNRVSQLFLKTVNELAKNYSVMLTVKTRKLYMKESIPAL